MEERGWKKWFGGDRAFYKKILVTALPLALANLLGSCQSVIDTIMVSRIGAVTAVGTAAQIDLLSILVSYGCLSGTGIFLSQFYGAGDQKNLKKCAGMGFLMVAANAVFWLWASTFFGREILGFYIQDEAVIASSLEYLSIARFAYFISSFAFAFNTMFRSVGRPGTALRISIMATVINIVMNAVLIFGIGPFPAMGVKGAALASVIAQAFSFTTLLTIAITSRQPFMGTLKELFVPDLALLKKMWKRTLPLIVNETLFGVGQTLFIKAFGVFGKEPMDAYYAGQQIYDMANFIIYGYGNAAQILCGIVLGQGKTEQARKECNYYFGLTLVLSLLLGGILWAGAAPFSSIFHLSGSSAITAIWIVRIFGIKGALRMFNYVIFCILRSGGDTRAIQFLDAGLEWGIGVPLAFLCVHWIKVPSLPLVLLIVQAEQLVRMILGLRRIYQFRWAKDLTR